MWATDIAALPGFEEAGLDTAQAVLEECARFNEGVVAPLNVAGDRNPSSWKDGRVTTTPGFKEAFRQFAHQFRASDGGGVHRHLVGAGPQQGVDVVHGPHPAADGERDEHLLGGPRDDVVGRRTLAAARGDVEKGQLVRALAAVPSGQLDGVPRVAQAGEVHALDDPALVDVEAGDDPDRDPVRGGVGRRLGCGGHGGIVGPDLRSAG